MILDAADKFKPLSQKQQAEAIEEVKQYRPALSLKHDVERRP